MFIEVREGGSVPLSRIRHLKMVTRHGSRLIELATDDQSYTANPSEIERLDDVVQHVFPAPPETWLLEEAGPSEFTKQAVIAWALDSDGTASPVTVRGVVPNGPILFPDGHVEDPEVGYWPSLSHWTDSFSND
jgi:hypothetical protein